MSVTWTYFSLVSMQISVQGPESAPPLLDLPLYAPINTSTAASAVPQPHRAEKSGSLLQIASLAHAKPPTFIVGRMLVWPQMFGKLYRIPSSILRWLLAFFKADNPKFLLVLNRCQNARQSCLLKQLSPLD